MTKSRTYIASQTGQAGMAIQQVALGIRTQQGLMGVLTMNIHQPLTHLTQLLRGGR